MRSFGKYLISFVLLILVHSSSSVAYVQFGGNIWFNFREKDETNVFVNMTGNVFVEDFPILDVSTASRLVGAGAGSCALPPKNCTSVN